MVSNHENYDDFESSELSFFQKIEQMGSGTYGEVWKGKNILNNEIIAIKKIKMRKVRLKLRLKLKCVGGGGPGGGGRWHVGNSKILGSEDTWFKS